ncbi:hypothetical protein ACFFRR_002070 [Megaselia abdita]
MERYSKLLLFPLLLQLVLSEHCPPSEAILPCRCLVKDREIQIWCSHSYLPQIMEGVKQVERNVKSSVGELILENNQLPALSGRFFGNMQIVRLMLRHNNIERVSNGWLNELENSLVEIFIVEPHLRSIPVESLTGHINLAAVTIHSLELKHLPDFSGLLSLKYISIQSGSLQDISPHIFRHTPKLQNIHINGGLLTRIEKGTFENLISAQIIDLSRNSISWIHLRAFVNLPNLGTLKLSQNQIEDVGMIGRGIKDLISLKKLRLDKNQITSVPEGSFVDLENLAELHLNDNRIREIGYGAFHRTPNLKTIYLHNNIIKRIHPESFLQSSGSGVESIHLYHNEINRIDELRSILDALPTLKFLDLSDNLLQAIPFGVLRGHGTIEQLYINNNLLTNIDRDSLMAMPALRELRLRNNSLSDTVSTPFWNLPGLKGLDLKSNKFRHLDSLFLSGLPSLRRLDVSENQLELIEPDTFIHTPMLETFNISFNQLVAVHPETFRSLDRLFEIDAGFNRMVDVIPGLPRIVERLSYRGNRISTLSTPKSLNLPNLRMLDLSENNLEHLPKLSFQGVGEMRVLSLAYNRLRQIEGATFYGLRNLELLHLQDNQISRIEEGSFQGMGDLRDLNLEGNKLESLKDIFSNNTKLEMLDLGRNNIREISPTTFDQQKSLEYLDLAGNFLEQISISLSNLYNVKDIDLSYNQISVLPSEILSSWKNVAEIRISNNRINELAHATFRNLPSLQYLDLSSNRISNIEPGALKHLADLQEFVLADNRLVELRDQVFEDVPNLLAAHLQHNNLKYISPDSFFNSRSLVFLNLSSNNFQNMENIGLRNLRNLEVLDLSRNGIKVVSTMPLQVLKWLVELKLDNNEICKIHGSPFETMPRLRVLSLRNNRLRRMRESSFRNLRGNIAILDVDGNPIQCTCEMQWLSVWLNETNFPLPGPLCDNGKLLRSARFDKAECSDYRSAQELPLLNEHGDIFNRQLSDEFNEQCDELPQNYKNRPLAGESEYFYDQFIDYPPKDGPNISHIDLNPSQKYHTDIDLNNTVLNTNFLSHPPPPPESSFTFFGYPLNFGRIFGGRSRNADRRNEKSVSPRSPTARGLIKSDLERYLKESQARVRFVDSSSDEGYSGEISSTFRTAFKPPTVEKGGFRPILPKSEYGFFPSPSTTTTPQTVIIQEKKLVQIMTKEPQITHNSLVIPRKGNVVRVVSTVSSFPVNPTTFVEPVTSTTTTTTTIQTPSVTSSTTTERTPSEEEYDEDYEQIEQTTQKHFDQGDEEEILNVSESSIESSPETSTSETILLIPPEDEQTTIVFTRPPFSTPSTPIVFSTRPVISRSKITKVPSPKSAFDVNQPTAEEYSRTAGYSDNEPSNEFLTTGEEEQNRQQEFDITTKKGMEWYYEDYKRANKRRASNDEAFDKVQYQNASCKQRIDFSFIFVSMFFFLSGIF